MSDPGLPTADGLSGVRVPADGIEVQRSRAEIRSRLFGGPAAPTRLGRFVVLEQLGVGGMGVVYAAYDPQLDRRVALKVLRTDTARGRKNSRQEELLDEARAMAKLSHPNVITVYEVGTVDDRVFIAMECIEGQTLRAWLHERQPTPSEIVEVMRQAGEGLNAAHEAGLVHRDFKPENVLVPERGPVRVTDFGLARLQTSADTSTGEAGDNGTTRIVGTPAYMAPEQVRGHEVDARSDQYSFCVTFFEALQGRRPMIDADVERLRTDPDWSPPALTVPGSTGLTRRQRTALERGLALSPAQRHPSMRSLLRALVRRRRFTPVRLALGASLVLSGTWLGLRVGEAQTEACSPPVQALAGVWDDDVRARARAAFEAVDVPYARTAWQRASEGLDEYAQAWLSSMQESCRNSGGEPDTTLARRRVACLDQRRAAVAATTTLFTDADAQVVEHAVTSVMELPDLATCSDVDVLRTSAFETRPDDPAYGKASDALEMARASWRLRRYDEGRQWAADAARRAKELDHPRVRARANEILGRFELALANVEEANEAFENVIAAGGAGASAELVAAAGIGLVEAAGIAQAEHEEALVLARAAEIATASAGNPPALRSRLELAYGRILYGAGRFDDGLARVRSGLQQLEQLGESRRPELAEALQVHGTLLYAKGRLGEAEEMSDRALELRRALLGPRHPAVAESQAHLAAIALARGNFDEAVRSFSDAAQIQRGALGAEHPAYARTLANLGSAHRAAGRMQEARTHTKAAIAILSQQFESSDPRLAAIEQNLAGIEHELGNYDEALRAYRAALLHQQEALGESHPQVATTMANLGRLQLERGAIDEARANLSRSLTIRREALGPRHAKTAAVMVDLAEADLSQRRFGEAQTLLDDALSIYEETLGPDHLEVAAVLTVMGKLELRQRRFAEAEELLARAQRLRETAGASATAMAAVRLLRAHALSNLGHTTEAQALAHDARVVLTDRALPPDLRSWCATDCTAELTNLLP